MEIAAPAGQNGRVKTSFPPAKKGRGYRPEEVDAFLERARASYDGAEGLTSADIRATSFGLVRKGYSTAHVDAALERLEDAFASRERERRVDEAGREEWIAEATTTAQVLLNRLTRPEGERFRRVSILASGYDRAEVDAFADVVARYFTDGAPLSIERVRTVVFRQRKGGYDEAQVDAVLDAVVETMLAVR